jgi:hypothetical protein
MGPPSGHLFYSRGMTVLKPPTGIPANSAGNAEMSEQRRARARGARDRAMAGLSTSAARASGVSRTCHNRYGQEEQQRGSGVIGLARLENPRWEMRVRGPIGREAKQTRARERASSN